MSCIDEILTIDMPNADCGNDFIDGLESGADVILINKEDVETLTTANGVTSVLTLKVGKTGFSLGNVKRLSTTAYERVDEDARNSGYTHTYNGVLMNPTAAITSQIESLGETPLIAVTRNRWKGDLITKGDEFKLLGEFHGVKLRDHSKAEGAPIFSLVTEEGTLEPKSPSSLLLGTNADTVIAYGNKFAS